MQIAQNVGNHALDVVRYDAFEHLRRSLFLRESDLMAMFTIYCDASGTDPNQTVYTVGGFLADVRVWDSLNKEWPCLLALSGREEYHATDIEDSMRLWGWSKDHKEEVQALAYSIVKRHVHIGISSTVIKADFDAARVRWRKIPYGKTAQYFYFCVNDVLARVTDWAMERGFKDPINFVFECGDPGWGEVKAMFEEIPNDSEYERRELIGSVTFGKKRRLFPLQAADLWTYENWKQMINQHMPLALGAKQVQPRYGYKLLMRDWWRKYNIFWDHEAISAYKERVLAAGFGFDEGD
jgi:hypothetical protein